MNRLRAALCALVCAWAGQAGAVLYDRGGGMIYDSTRNLTWLQDWNYAQTSGYDADGLMTWDEQMSWAAQLQVGGFTDWRLPSALNSDGSGPCYTFPSACADSDLGHMFFTVFGATAGQSVLAGSNTANLAMFKNMGVDFLGRTYGRTYWTSTEFVNARGHDGAWYFLTNDGEQNSYYKCEPATVFGPDGPCTPIRMSAVAVRAGDVLAVPEAQTIAMFLLGLGLLALRRHHWCRSAW